MMGEMVSGRYRPAGRRCGPLLAVLIISISSLGAMLSGCAAPRTCATSERCAASRECEQRPNFHSPCAVGDGAPCGPQAWPIAVRRWIPQQFRGADFRPACRCHDACYADPNIDRRVCDERFREDLAHSCDASRFPLACRAITRVMHCCVSNWGGWFKAR